MNPATEPGATELPPDLDGYMDQASCEQITGWAWDKNHPERPVKIEVFDNGSPVAFLTADHLREDLRDLGIGTGKYGFVYPIPRSLRDGKPHLVSLKIAGSEFELNESPQELTCSP
jgi:hypothetical protein